MEAGRLQEAQDEFIAETGLGFSFIFALYEGASGRPATVDDLVSYHERIGSPDFPLLADASYALVDASPMTQLVHPEMCALTPEFELMSCYSGHGSYEDALQDIREHAGIQ